MAQWGKNDQADNSPFETVGGLDKPANTANRDALFGNTTADAFVTGQTVGQFGVDSAEAQAARAGAGTKVAHAGWNLRRAGSGGRAGRVQMETIVAMASGSMTGDASDDTILPDFEITIITQPVSASGNSASDDVVSFVTLAQTAPPGQTITYTWQESFDAGNTWATATSNGVQNSAAATLEVWANAGVDGISFRCQVSGTGATTKTTNEAVITIT